MSGVALPFAPFKALALSIAAIILALTPISSLTYWVESESETAYSSPAYTVTYKPNVLNRVTGSNETRVKIEVVDERGKPLKFVAFLSGPAHAGAVEVGNVSGKGHGVIAIGRYVSEINRVLRELNSDPKTTGIGMLVLISAVIEEDGEYYVVGDAISVPITPGKALGKDIIVKVRLTPIFKYKIELENLTKNRIEDQILNTPPQRITEECQMIGSPPTFSTRCYYWRIEQVIYATPSDKLDYVPLMVTLLDTYTGISTRMIQHSMLIKLIQRTVASVSFSLSFGIADPNRNTISINVVGEAWKKEIELGETEQTLYRATCRVSPARSGDPSFCVYLENNMPREVSFGYFDGDVIFSTGFYGRMWLLRYSFIEEIALYGIIPVYRKVIRENDLAVWVVPAFDSSKSNIMFGWELDDRWGDGLGTTERMLRMLGGNYTYSHIESWPRAYSMFLIDIYRYYWASPNLGLTFPVGALILAILAAKGVTLPLVAAAIVASLAVGINAQIASEQLYKDAGYFYIELSSSDKWISIFTARMKEFYKIKAEDYRGRPAPLMIFRPITG